MFFQYNTKKLLLLTTKEIKRNRYLHLITLLWSLLLMVSPFLPIVIYNFTYNSIFLTTVGITVFSTGLVSILWLAHIINNLQISTFKLEQSYPHFATSLLEWTNTYPEVKKYIQELNKIREIYYSDWVIINYWVYCQKEEKENLITSNSSDLIKLTAL